MKRILFLILLPFVVWGADTFNLTNLPLATNITTSDKVVGISDGTKMRAMPLSSLPVKAENVSGTMSATLVGQLDATNIANLPAQVWTNDGTYIWLVDQVPPEHSSYSSAEYPASFFHTNGSHYYGKAVGQDADINTSTLNALYSVSLIDSNEFPTTVINASITDNLTDWSYFAAFSLAAEAGKDNPYSNFGMSVQNTNNVKREFQLRLDTADGSDLVDLSTNSASIFIVNAYGVATANGYQDSSLTPGSIVGVGTAGRLSNWTNGHTGDLTVVTNGTDTATLHITNGLIMSITSP